MSDVPLGFTPGWGLTTPAGAGPAARWRWPAHLGWWCGGVAAALPVLLLIHLMPAHPVVMAAAGVAGLVGVGMVMRNPAWGACALILIIYWNASDVLTDGWGFSWLLRLAMLGTAGVWAVRELLGSERGSWRWPVAAPFFAYGAVQALAAVGAIDKAAAATALFEFGKAAVVFYLVANLLRTPRALRLGVNALLLGVVLLSLPVIFQGITGTHNQFWGFGSMKYAEIVPGEWGWRLAGAMGDPNFLAMVLVATLPLGLVQIVERRAAWWRRGFALAAVALALGATYFTYSRAALLGVGLVAVAALWKWRRRRGVLALALLLLLGGLPLLPREYLARFLSIGAATHAQATQIGDASILIRRNALLSGALMFAQHPLFGVGPGNYEANYLHYSALVGLSRETVVRDPHSLVIQIAAETGLAGIIAFTLLLLASYRLMERGRRLLSRCGAHNFADLIWALELAIATYLLVSVFLHGAYFRHFLLLLALGTLGGTLAIEARASAVGARP